MSNSAKELSVGDPFFLARIELEILIDALDISQYILERGESEFRSRDPLDIQDENGVGVESARSLLELSCRAIAYEVVAILEDFLNGISDRNQLFDRESSRKNFRTKVIPELNKALATNIEELKGGVGFMELRELVNSLKHSRGKNGVLFRKKMVTAGKADETNHSGLGLELDIDTDCERDDVSPAVARGAVENGLVFLNSIQQVVAPRAGKVIESSKSPDTK